MCTWVLYSHAYDTEDVFVGKNLNDPSFVPLVMNSLDGEVNPSDSAGNPSAAYLKHVAKALVYKVCYLLTTILANSNL